MNDSAGFETRSTMSEDDAGVSETKSTTWGDKTDGDRRLKTDIAEEELIEASDIFQKDEDKVREFGIVTALERTLLLGVYSPSGTIIC